MTTVLDFDSPTERAIAAQRAQAWQDMARFDRNRRSAKSRCNGARFIHWDAMHRAARAVWMRLSSSGLNSYAEITGSLYYRAQTTTFACEHDYIMVALNAINDAHKG